MSSGEVPDSIPCKKYPKPVHGTVRCGGNLCLVQCDHGYLRNEQHAFIYKCDTKLNEWKSIPEGKPVPWPDCDEVTNLFSRWILFYVKRFSSRELVFDNCSYMYMNYPGARTKITTYSDKIFELLLLNSYFSYYKQ